MTKTFFLFVISFIIFLSFFISTCNLCKKCQYWCNPRVVGLYPSYARVCLDFELVGLCPIQDPSKTMLLMTRLMMMMMKKVVMRWMSLTLEWTSVTRIQSYKHLDGTILEDWWVTVGRSPKISQLNECLWWFNDIINLNNWGDT